MSSLAATRADGYYYPKDFDPNRDKTLNRYNQKKGVVKQDSNVVRFEMMFHVRCEGCLKSIGKGVRFNARKHRVGQYLSTPIYAFHMTCHLCRHELVVETDPKTTDFIMKKGLHRIRPQTYDGLHEDTEGKKDGANKDDAFETLERVKLDKEAGRAAMPTLQQILD